MAEIPKVRITLETENPEILNSPDVRKILDEVENDVNNNPVFKSYLSVLIAAILAKQDKPEST